MCDSVITEIRALELREMELDKEKELIRRRRRELLCLEDGARKPKRKMLTPAQGKALFADLKRAWP